MKKFYCRITRWIISFAFLACSESVYANFDDANPARDRRGCGDYTVLSDARDRAVFDRHCGINTGKDLEILRDLAARLDPKREAHAAALRGDFRLAAVIDGGPPPPDRIKLWDLAGIDCKSVEDKDVFIWARLTDALTGPISSFQGHMLMFASAYNRAMISEPSFPSYFSCTPIANAP